MVMSSDDDWNWLKSLDGQWLVLGALVAAGGASIFIAGLALGLSIIDHGARALAG